MKRVFASVLLALFLSGCGGSTPYAALVSSRLEPWTNAQGQPSYMVYTDWKNTGTTPIRAVYANIDVYDASGAKVYEAKDYTIYATANSLPGIGVGETYVEPAGEGHVVIPIGGGTPARVTVTITRAKEQSGL